MHIITLGTSHGDMTYCRYNSATLIEVGNGKYLIDAGAPVDGQLVRCRRNVNDINAVFITHSHADHIGGLPILIKAIIKYPRDGLRCEIFLPEERCLSPLLAWTDVFYSSRDRINKYIGFHTAAPGQVYEDENIRVRAIATAHIRIEGAKSFAYLIEEKSTGKKILYSGDLARDFSDFPDCGSGSFIDLCLCEATHYKPETAMPRLESSNFGRLIFNHIHNPWHGEGEAVLLGFASKLPYPTAVAHDLDEFEI